jgi:prephenate dehydrogenase
MAAAEHDQMVARVSHLPHITAASLMNTLENSPSCLELAAGGLRDTTRIAGSEPQMWVDILSLNREAIVPELEEMVGSLEAYLTCLKEGNLSELVRLLGAARQTRRKVPAARACLDSAADIIAIVPDRPGIIGIIGKLLGDERININDIQIMGVRDEDEGSLRLGVPAAEAAKAIQVLSANGIRAWLRT